MSTGKKKLKKKSRVPLGKKKVKAQTDTHQRPGNPDWRHKINAPAGGRAPATTEQKTIGNKTIGNHRFFFRSTEKKS